MKIRAILLHLALGVSAVIGYAQGPVTDSSAQLYARFQNVHLVQTIPGALEVRPVFSPDSSRIIYCRPGIDFNRSNPHPAVWDLGAGALQGEQKKIGWCEDYSFAPDGSITAVGYFCRVVGACWIETHDLASGKELSKLTVPGERYFFEPGVPVAMLSIHKKLALWDLNSNALVHQFDLPSEAAIVRVLPGSKMVMTYYPNADSIYLWNGETGERTRTFPCAGRLFSWNVSRDGHLLATAYSGTIQIWEIASGKILQTMNPGANRLFSLAFSPDNHVLASINDDGDILFWDAATGSQIGSLPTATTPFARLQFSPDGRLLAATGPKGSKSIRIWQIPQN